MGYYPPLAEEQLRLFPDFPRKAIPGESLNGRITQSRRVLVTILVTLPAGSKGVRAIEQFIAHLFGPLATRSTKRPPDKSEGLNWVQGLGLNQ